MTTLSVTDLDGTLLAPGALLTPDDRVSLGRLVHERGILLTYATARPFRDAETAALGRFLADRPGDPRFAPVGSARGLARDRVFAVTVMGPREPVGAAAAEIDALGTAAGRSVSQDAHHRAQRVVCFGDNHNDLSMFAVADEAYAVADAVDAVRAAATGVIGSNAGSGVVRWLWEHS
jgi:hypothetical protein